MKSDPKWKRTMALWKLRASLALFDFSPRKATPRISFCTTCMGRLHHLKETLPRNIEDNKDYPELELVVLDYNSPDSTGAWIHESDPDLIRSGRLNDFRTTEPKYFHMAHSKNVAHRLATGDIVCNVDADNFTGPGFAAKLAEMFLRGPRRLLVSGDWRVVKGSNGRVAMWRKHFLAFRGYDESMHGYGFEDQDLISRCELLGFEVQKLERESLNLIQHSHEERQLLYAPEHQKLNKGLVEHKAQSHSKIELGLVVPNPKRWGHATLSPTPSAWPASPVSVVANRP